MRIRELYLKAYGPFTERRLDLGSEDFVEGRAPGLCVVHGPNEAGKSSALRAVRDLLYGIPERTTDDFLHRKADLRIGGRLVFADGEELAFLRRKGRKATLRDYQSDAAIEVPRLEELERLVPEWQFRSFYGLDHEALSRGSEALLADDGDLGRALYSAGLGAGRLRELLASLDAEAEALFKPRGQNQRINAGLSALRDLRTELKKKTVRPREWSEVVQRKDDAERTLAEIVAARQERQAQAARLGRVASALPLRARRDEAERRLAALEAEGLRELGDEFESLLREARDGRRHATEVAEQARQDEARLEARLRALVLSPRLVEARDEIQAFVSRWGAIEKDLDDLPRREADLARLERAVREGLEAVGASGQPDAFTRLREVRTRTKQIEDHVEAHGALQASLRRTAEEIEQARLTLERIEAERDTLGDPVDLDPLRAALARADHEGGSVDAWIESQEEALEELGERCEQGRLRLGLGPATARRIERARVPSLEVLERFEREDRELGERAARWRDQVESREAEQVRVEADLATLRSERAVPTEDDLSAARAQRDEAWQLLRPVIRGERAADEADIRGAERLEAATGRADEVADRLRRDADRVSRHATLVAQRDRLTAEAERQTREGEAIEQARTEWRRAWEALWEGLDIDPGPPTEALAWRRALDVWRERCSERTRQERALERARTQRDELRRHLEEALGAVEVDAPEAGSTPLRDGPRLDLVRRRARALLESASDREGQRSRLAERRLDAEQILETARRRRREDEARLEAWSEDWRAAVDGLGFVKEPRPGEALDRLHAVAELFDDRGKRDEMADRVAKMKRDVERFDADLEALLDQVAPDLRAQERLDARLDALRRRLEDASGQAQRAADLEEARTEASERRAKAEADLERARHSMAELVRKAGVEEEALDTAVRLWREATEARRRRDEAHADLLQLGEQYGLTVADLEAESADVDPETLAAEQETLAREIESLEDDEGRRRVEVAQLREKLAVLDRGDEAASLAARIEQERAVLREAVQRYVVVRLARETLDQEIERYRQANQAPVLARARELFRRLTVDRYASVDADPDVSGRIGLVALDRAGRRVPVDHMSSGTRDQLFLALRLATIEESLERMDPIPLISDDILVHFDDERSRAGLEVLADLGGRTQVLLFTHHDHVRDQARALGPDRARVLELGPDPSPA